jgi:uncharacterized protein (DUF885 family)
MNERLTDLAERLWDVIVQQGPVTGSVLGDHRYADRLGDLSEDAEAAFRDAFVALRDAADEIDDQLLDRDDRITRAMAVQRADRGITEIDCGLSELRCDPFTGPHATLLRVLTQLRLTARDHVEGHLARLSQVDRFLGQALDRLRSGVAKGRTPPRVGVARVAHQLDSYLGRPVDADPLLRPIAGASAAVRDRALELIRDVVRPAVAAYRDGLHHHVLPRARPDDRPGLVWVPGGEVVYTRLVDLHTTLPADVDGLHTSGLEDLTGALADELGGIAGPLLGTADLGEIFVRLREEPALRFEDDAEPRAVAEACLQRATAVQDAWFGRLPAAECIVTEVPDYLAADMPVAYYLAPAPDGSRPGTYYLNLHDPAALHRFEAESIAFHEAVPGHHLQRALATELDHLPMFRRHAPATAYVEGWGLYAERLADEMGVYSAAWDRVGMVVADMWRAGRLVVDTGLHAKGWSRDQAVDFLRTHTAQPHADIDVEVDRYIGWPAQALAYKVGQREILRLRDQARAARGERFDIRGFHDAVLGSGPLALPVLGDVLAQWVAETGKMSG